jgi:hypothetical protein
MKHTKFLVAAIATSLTFTANANCIDKYNSDMAQRKESILKEERDLKALKLEALRLKESCEPHNKALIGSILQLLALPMGLAGLATAPITYSFSALTSLSYLAPFAAASAGSMVTGTYLERQDLKQYPICSKENFQIYADSISVSSYKLINLKYLNYSEDKIVRLMSEIDREESGTQSVDFLKDVKTSFKDTQLSNSKILQMVKEINSSELICDDSFKITNISSFEKGFTSVINKSISLDDISGHKVANPFIESEALNKLSNLKIVLAQVKQQVKELKEAEKNLREASSRNNGSENNRESRKENYMKLITTKDLLNNALSVVLNTTSSIKSLEKTQDGLEIEIKHLNIILAK